MVEIDCAALSTREINQRLAQLPEGGSATLQNPMGRHNIGVGLRKRVSIVVNGHSGYYYGGMNQGAHIVIHGNAGQGVGENMMEGSIRVRGYASSAAGASAHGGLLTIDRDAALRCGISLKGADIVVGGSVGNMCGFMAQKGHIVICGDAGEALGDSLYEAVIYLRGKFKSLGADARVEPMGKDDFLAVKKLLDAAEFSHDAASFRRIASAKTLYHFDAGKKQTY